MSKHTPDMPEDVSVTPVGVRLRQAREAAGLTARQVADRLHIILRFVEAIEQDDHDALPGTVFLKGYVRGYAELLSLDPEPLLADLDTQLSMQGKVTTEQQPQSDRARMRRKGLWMFVLIVVGAIGFAFWQGQSGQESSGEAESAVQAPPAVTEPGQPGARSGDVMAPDQKASQETMQSKPDTQPDAEVESAVPAVEASAEEPVADLQPVQGETPNRQGVGEAAQVEATAQDEAADEAIQVLPVEAQLVAVFEDRCWFDARTGDGQREVGLFKAGDVVRLSGAFPLSVIVGNVEAVTLRVNDIPVDFSRFRVRNKRAEFQLTAEALVSE
ncbi:MAG: DUF4115 domain-containing protein [Gammaproteobacteria bacterium]|nr:MAG: DUF4115 domain-containing protein [Gammaproteobacteria bacterium]